MTAPWTYITQSWPVAGGTLTLALDRSGSGGAEVIGDLRDVVSAIEDYVSRHPAPSGTEETTDA